MEFVSEEQQSRFQSLPSPLSCRVLDFDSADILTETPLGYWALFVDGEKPYDAMEVTLRPLTYIRQPEYWGIEIVGCLPSGPLPDVTGRYLVILPVAGVMGTKGIEVIGANGVKQIDLPEAYDGPQLR